MLILLPPSEGKAPVPASGDPVDLAALSFPSLTPARERVLDALVRISGGPRTKALDALGLTPGLAAELEKNAALLTSPAMPAAALYTGVLFDALDLAGLPAAARRRADEQLVVFSALFGALRPTDLVPSYRLSPNARLPRLGTLASVWKAPLAAAMEEAAEGHVVLDLRSGPYAALWRPTPDTADRTLAVRVLHETTPGRRQVVSHFNKATKGRLVASLLRRRATPRTRDDLVEAIRSAGWTVEPGPKPGTVDVVVSAL